MTFEDDDIFEPTPEDLEEYRRLLPLSDDDDDLDDSDDEVDPWTLGDQYEADGYYDDLAAMSEAQHYLEAGLAIW